MRSLRAHHDVDQFDDDGDDSAFLTPWEADFLASIDEQEFDMTPAQEAKLDEIEFLIEERRALARKGRPWRR